MKIIALDTETTGLLEPEHRLIEVYAARFDLATRAREAELEIRIDPQRSIAPDAYRVHGISSMDLIGKPKFEDVANDIAAFIASGDLVVAHNGDGFDLPFINMELARIGAPTLNFVSVDTMLDCRWATPSGKPPSLAELCFACGVEYDPAKAHAAAYDVEVMWRAFVRAHDWGFITLPSVSAISQ